MILDAEGSDVGCKAVTTVLTVPYLRAAPFNAPIEGTMKTIVKDTEHVKEPDSATKSSGAVYNIESGTEAGAHLTTTYKEYLSVLARDLPNVAPAYGDVVDDVTPHGCGVGEPLIVSVATGDATDAVRNTVHGRNGRTSRIRHKNSLAKDTGDAKNKPPTCT